MSYVMQSAVYIIYQATFSVQSILKDFEALYKLFKQICELTPFPSSMLFYIESTLTLHNKKDCLKLNQVAYKW